MTTPTLSLRNYYSKILLLSLWGEKAVFRNSLVCTFVYWSKILEYLLYSAFEYQKYDFNYSTQNLSTKCTTSNTLLNVLSIKSMTSNTLLKYWVSTLRTTRIKSMDWVWLQILYSNFEYQKYGLKYSIQILSTSWASQDQIEIGKGPAEGNSKR